MTVGELITLLQAIPRNTRVVLDGYEDGLCDAREATLVAVNLNRNYPSGVYGWHELAKPGDPGDEMAMYLPRDNGRDENYQLHGPKEHGGR
jgi:hypothetical protein